MDMSMKGENKIKISGGGEGREGIMDKFKDPCKLVQPPCY